MIMICINGVVKVAEQQDMNPQQGSRLGSNRLARYEKIMGWCIRFKRAIIADVIEFLDGVWYMKQHEINYCPFCGAKLIVEDI